MKKYENLCFAFGLHNGKFFRVIKSVLIFISNIYKLLRVLENIQISLARTFRLCFFFESLRQYLRKLFELFVRNRAKLLIKLKLFKRLSVFSQTLNSLFNFQTNSNTSTKIQKFCFSKNQMQKKERKKNFSCQFIIIDDYWK